MTGPSHVLNAGDSTVKRAGLFPAVRELTIFEFKTSYWIANRADITVFWLARWGSGERVYVGRAC